MSLALIIALRTLKLPGVGLEEHYVKTSQAGRARREDEGDDEGLDKWHLDLMEKHLGLTRDTVLGNHWD